MAVIRRMLSATDLVRLRNARTASIRSCREEHTNADYEDSQQTEIIYKDWGSGPIGHGCLHLPRNGLVG
jgi:hypothetical protein